MNGTYADAGDNWMASDKRLGTAHYFGDAPLEAPPKATNPYAAPEAYRAEIQDRLDYLEKPWRERLTTRPPAGLQGAWMARLGSRLAKRWAG